MPLPKQFHAFYDGRLMRINIEETNLGSQDSLIRSLNQRALMRVPEIDLPEFDSFFKEPIILKTRQSPEREPVEETRTILDPKRKLKVAINENSMLVAFPLSTLTYFSHFAPHNLPLSSGRTFKALRAVGRESDISLSHLAHVPMPDNTWLFINLTGEKEFSLANIMLEIHDGKTVRIPHMNNLYENGSFCVGTLGTTNDGSPKRFRMPRREAFMLIFKEFLNSFWNDHLSKPNIPDWLRWDMDFNYIHPNTPMSRWTYTAGSNFSPYAQ